MSLHKKGKKLIVLFSLVWLLAACGSREETAPKNWKSRRQIQETDLQEWCGYYTRSGKTRENGWVGMDFILYEKEGIFWGYLSVDGHEYHGEMADTYQNKRILTTVQAHAGEVFVYFYEEIPIENESGTFSDGQGDYFGACTRGDLLFSMKQEGEDILTTWERPFLTEAEESLNERKFYRFDMPHLSCTLLGEKDRDAFLTANGIMAEEVPFFVYDDEDSGRQFTVYTDAPAAGGIGIYCEGGRIWGFGIPACSGEAWVDERFEVTYGGDTGEQLVEDYTASRTYNEQGQLIRFLSEGTITDIEEPHRDRVIEITYTYRDDGTLEQKEGFYNAWIFGSVGCSERCFYDEKGRLAYSSAYITHGSLDNYYIYSGDDVRPDYGIMLDYDGSIHAYEFVHYTD